MVMIPKTKKPEPKEHRPIALTNVGYKIFISLIKDKMVEHIRKRKEYSRLTSCEEKDSRQFVSTVIL